jgi:hypothetical protein
MRAARDAGYRLAFTLTDDFQGLPVDPWAFTRLTVAGHLDHAIFDARVHGTQTLLRRAMGGSA